MKSMDEIVSESNAVFALLTELDGELTPDLEMRLNTLASEFGAKAEAYQHVAATLSGEIETAKKLASEYTDHARVVARRLDLLKERLAWAMDAMGGQPIKTAKGNITLGYSDSVEIVGTVDEQYMKPPKPAEPTPDKTKIKDAIKSGAEVHGAQLIKKPFIRGL